MTAILEQLQGLVAAAEIPAGTLGVALILGLFGLMVVGLVLGQELAFVLGGAGVIVGWLAWGTPGVTIAMTKIYDQMQSYSMVAIPMFVLMANFLTHSKVADGLFESIRYLLGPLKGGLGLAVILVSTVFAATTGIVGASVVTMGMLSLPVLLRSGYKPSLACGMVCAGRLPGHSDPALHHAGLHGLLRRGLRRQDLLRRHRPRPEPVPGIHHLPDGGLPHPSRLGPGHESRGAGGDAPEEAHHRLPDQPGSRR